MKTIRKYINEAKSDWHGASFVPLKDLKVNKVIFKEDTEYTIKEVKKGQLEITDNDEDVVVVTWSEKQVDEFFDKYYDDIETT